MPNWKLEVVVKIAVHRNKSWEKNNLEYKNCISSAYRRHWKKEARAIIA